MKIRRIWFWCLAGLLVWTLALAGQPSEEEALVSLHFEGVELATVIKYISEVTGKVVLFDPGRVKGKVTVIAPGKIPKEQLWPLFESILEVQGYTTVTVGSVVKIIPAAEAKTTGIEVRKGSRLDRPSPREAVVTQVVPLKYADAQELARTLAPLVSPRGHIVAYRPTNALIIVDYASNVARLVKLISGEKDAPSGQ